MKQPRTWMFQIECGDNVRITVTVAANTKLQALRMARLEVLDSLEKEDYPLLDWVNDVSNWKQVREVRPA